MKKIVYLFLMISGVIYGQNPYVISHRGNSSIAPENTNVAFSKAVEAGADYFELDVQLSSDDSLMIMHDATVDRTTDGTGTLENMTYTSLRLLDAGSWFNASFAGEKVPTLFEALMIAKNSTNGIKVVIEIKSSKAAIVSRVVQLVQKHGMKDRVIISSFTLSQISEAKSLDATIDVMFFKSPVTTADIDQVKAINGEWVGSGGSFTKDVIDYAHSKDISYNAWTVDSEITMRSLMAMGADAITTNVPATLIGIRDATPPSDVVMISAIPDNSSNIKLTWNPAEDIESGIGWYNIYRDEASPAVTLLATKVGTDVVFVDNTCNPLHTYYYRIKAVNTIGLSSVNYSNELSVTALNDTDPPAVEYVTSRLDNITVLVQFNEPLDFTSSETLTNYNIDRGISVIAAKLAKDKKTIILTTSSLSDQNYILSVQGVKDISGNEMTSGQFQFDNKNTIIGAIAVYKLDTLPIQGSDLLVMDETINHNDGKAKNSVTLAEGIIGNALSFDGVDDYVQFQNSSSFNIPGDKVTVSLWTKLDYKPSSLPGSFGPLFDSETDEYSLYEDRSNKELRFKATSVAGAARPGIPDTEIVTGEWINVVGVYNGTVAMIYLNGVKKKELALTGNVRSGVIPMLGKSGSTGTPSYFKGFIDEVEIYDRALTEAEIVEKYNQIKIAAVPYEPTGIFDTKTLDQITICPNPVANETVIRLGSDYKNVVISVIDQAGNVIEVLKYKSVSEVYLNCSRFKPGIYFLNIILNNTSTVNKKIVVK